MRQIPVAIGTLSFVLAACSGGGGGSSSPNDPPPQTIQTTLIAMGYVDVAAAVDPGASKLLRSQGELDLLSARLGGTTLPPQYQNPDFAANTLIYVEGPALNDPLSATRIRQADGGNGVNTITVEPCAAGAVAPGSYRSYAFYLAPASLAVATISVAVQSVVPDCTSVEVIDATRISAGDLPLSVGATNQPSRVITNEAEWAFAAGRIPASAMPPGFTPNFSSTILIYLEDDDDVANSYIRLARVWESEADKSVDVITEKCGGNIDFLPTHIAYSLYSIPKPTGPARLLGLGNDPPNCITVR